MDQFDNALKARLVLADPIFTICDLERVRLLALKFPDFISYQNNVQSIYNSSTLGKMVECGSNCHEFD